MVAQSIPNLLDQTKVSGELGFLSLRYISASCHREQSEERATRMKLAFPQVNNPHRLPAYQVHSICSPNRCAHYGIIRHPGTIEQLLLLLLYFMQLHVDCFPLFLQLAYHRGLRTNGSTQCHKEWHLAFECLQFCCRLDVQLVLWPTLLLFYLIARLSRLFFQYKNQIKDYVKRVSVNVAEQGT